jgi:hypothetical protein
MSHFLVLIFVLFTSLVSVGQNGFNPTVDSPVDLQANSDSAFVQGTWVALDEHSALTGPSVSEISCDRKEGYCHEAQASMVVFKDGAFTLTADSVDYRVVRWNEKEIVAQNISGICRVLNVLKFDLQQHKVYASQVLSEPVNDLPKMSREICNAVGMKLELHGETMFRQSLRAAK